MITVVIPVGPHPQHRRWLEECLASVEAQTLRADEILLVDDMAGLSTVDYRYRLWRAPWRLGVASAFNCGVGLARNELVFLLGSDDWLEPDCLERCADTYRKLDEGDRGRAFMFVGVRYEDGREDANQFTPCGAAMVTRTLWRDTGGFAPETASGASDAAFCSTFWNRGDAVRMVGVGDGDHPLYHARVHEGQDTAERGDWQGVILATRDLLTREWRRPEWGRFDP